MTKSYYITGAKIFNENQQFTGNVFIENGQISCIEKSVFPDREMLLQNNIIHIDAKGKYLIPGVIDDQVHFREPGLTHKGDLYTESRAAIAGGVTSFMEMPNTNPQTITNEALNNKLQIASTKSLANFSFYLGATNDNIEEIINVNPQNTCGIKVFMGSSTGNMLVDDQTTLENIFSQSPILVAIHSEDETSIQNNFRKFTQQYGSAIPITKHPEIRSEEACYLSTKRAIKMARKYHTRLHVLHLSTARELEFFEPGPSDNKMITAEVCIHHLWFSDEDYKEKGNWIKWNPAIKMKKNREALFQALLNGSIDVIATDHAPHTKAEKNNVYSKAPSGGPLVQHTLTAMLEFYHEGKISMEYLVDRMCHQPARLFDIDKRGFLREGFWADIVLIDPQQSWIVQPENILYKCGWSPFDGQQFRSMITHTFVNGNLVYQNGNFYEQFKGMPLQFNRS